MEKNRDKKKNWTSVPQAFFGVLTCALLPTAMFGVLSMSMAMARFALVIVLAHGILLGLPVFLLMRAKGWLNAWGCALAGFIVAIIPMGVWAWPLWYMDLQSDAWVGADRVQVLADGIPTVAGWIQYFGVLAFFGLLGAIAGSQFWSVTKEQMAERTNYASGYYARLDGTGFKKFRKRVRRHGGEIAASLLVVVILSWPTVFADRSCHNMFQYGNSFSPIYGFELSISKSQWRNLAGVMRAFAEQESLSFRREIDTDGVSLDSLYIGVCNDSGVNIEASKQDWSESGHQTHGHFPDDQVDIYIYRVKETAEWEELALSLEKALKEKWPSGVAIDDRRE